MVDDYRLACNACGRCCNSAPTLSLRELFRHRHRFVGALTIHRVPKRRIGERTRAGGREHALDADDIAACDALANALFHRARGANDEWIALTLQGYDYPSLGRCPALADDGRCSVHADKPSICGAVPLDPMLPDRLQSRVLAGRRDETAWLGANCIVGADDGTASVDMASALPLVTAGQLADRAALDTFRDALAFERAVWRDAVFASLIDGGPQVRAALARLAPGGYLTMSIVPVLLAVASVSAHCRALCIDFIDAQRALIDARIEAALARRRLDDRPATAELRGFAQALERAGNALAAMPAATAGTRTDAPRIDAWLDDRHASIALTA
ncbi:MULTISPECIES: YkgJ family cysteine cluster protein [unclassified Burkholderia]|uniref:YkgJ family cysteine cluster protein n=1 Tax=unclassified Burkholderia TaxID=2613784 RepID=UPI000F5827D5|nr:MULTISPECIES: YkgJ family cysteine cluster protein [unclassified Burkholderia]RQR44246.1 flagellin N-methylase [Burkholderia sp. Bp9131]RQR71068.1 flagellin N-methylase [Burkholderia sp. Bp9015]RQR97606.1 flagellin N-methylase [Burkholderia sp. Bp8994]RQS27613.1 flagellin N-methylase [Burkholderia sp. Bp8995]RQS43432.1 flagellin N-methylase [Burkholderia sp. Bp8990]